MRRKRIRSFRKNNRGLFLVLKMALVCYLAVFGISYMSTDTSAYLSSQSKVTQTITANWDEVDESELAFINKVKQTLKSTKVCSKDEKPVEAILKNKGSGPMLKAAAYDVYFAEEGNPKDGKKLSLDKGEGIVKVLAEGEKMELTYGAEKPGNYIFKVYQPGEEDEMKPIWSEIIKVDCKVKNDESDEEKDKTEDDKAADKKDEQKKESDNKEEKPEAKKENEADSEAKSEGKKQEPEKDKQKQTDSKDEPVNKPDEKQETDKDSAERKAPENNANENKEAEKNAATKQVKNIKKAEGESDEKEENTEVGK